MNNCTLYFDGGVMGNCGPRHPNWLQTRGAWAYRAIGNGGMVLREESGLLSPATSNMAELHGCLNALRWAGRQGYQRVLLRGDSRFVLDWLSGINRTTQLPHITPIQRQIAEIISCEVVICPGSRRAIRLTTEPGKIIVTPEHVPRSKNRYADALCRTALTASS